MLNDHVILLTGATGFVGSSLVASLEGEFSAIRCATRSTERALKSWPARTWVTLDASRKDSVIQALEGVHTAYYLIHAMAEGKGYEDRERQAAEHFAEAAEITGVSRIVYLGGVVPENNLSQHLQSRQFTGEILQSGTVPCIELRAGMIVGSGSTSWQMVRDLSTRLPVMVLPSWLSSRSQPVAIDDVVAALIHAALIVEPAEGCFSLPGPEILSAKEILFRVSKLRGFRPVTVDVPFVSPQLSAYWIEFVTRASRSIARELVEGLKSDLITSTQPYWELMPDHQLTSFDDAARNALALDEKNLSPLEKLFEEFVSRISLSD